MKSFKLKSIIIIAIIGLAQVVTSANTNPIDDDYSRLYINKIDASTITVRLINLENQATSIILKGKDGVVLFDERIKNDVAYASKFDLRSLPYGSYAIHVNRENKTIIQFMSISKEGITVEGLKEIIQPTVNRTDAGFTISQKGVNVLNVSLLNKNDDVVYTKGFDNKEAATLKFNTQKLIAGSYIIKIKTSDDVYFEQYLIK